MAIALDPDEFAQVQQQLEQAEAEIERLHGAIAAERQRCADIALAIDSGRGNEKEIARAILNPVPITGAPV